MAKPVKTRTAVSSAFLDDSQVDPSKLPRRLKTLKEFLVDAVEGDCRHFAKTMIEWRDEGIYKHFNPTWEGFLREHFDQPVEWIDHVIAGVAILDGPANLATAESVSRQRAIALAQNPQQLDSHGGSRKNDFQPYDHKVEKWGDNPDYLAARIARDRPDIQEKLKAGEYRSIRAAAVEAGIVRPFIRFTVGTSTDPRKFAASLKSKLDPEFLAALIAELTGDSGKS